MPPPYTTLGEVAAARASGELNQAQYLDALRTLRAAGQPAPAPAAPGARPIADVNLPEQADIGRARAQNIAEREDSIRLNNPLMSPVESRRRAIDEYAASYGVDPEPRTIGEAARRALAPRTLQSLQEQEQERLTAQTIRARGVEEIARLRASGASREMMREAAQRYAAMAKQVEAMEVEGPIARTLRLVGGTIANVPIELVGRQAEFTETAPTAGGVAERALGTLFPGVPALVRQVTGARPEQPLVAEEERARTRRTGTPLDIVHDYFQGLERGEGFMDLVQAAARTQGIQPGTAGYTAATVAGFLGDVLIPWEGVLAAGTKPAKALSVAAKAARLAPEGARAASAVAAARAAFRLGDPVDVAKVASATVTPFLARFERPPIPDAIRAEMRDLASRMDNGGVSLDVVERELFDEKKVWGSGGHQLPLLYRGLVEGAYRREARQRLGTSELVRLTMKRFVTPGEAQEAARVVAGRFSDVGIDMPKFGRKVRDAGTYTPTPAEAAALGKLMFRNGLADKIGPVTKIDGQGWNALVGRALERATHPSAAPQYAKANADRIVGRMAAALMDTRAVKAPSARVASWLRSLKGAVDALRHDAPTAYAAPEVAAVLTRSMREIERAGEELVRDVRAVASRAEKDGVNPVRELLVSRIAASWRVPTIEEVDVAVDARKLGVDTKPADIAAVAQRILQSDRVEGELVPLLQSDDPLVVMSASKAWATRRIGDAQAFARSLLSAFAPRVEAGNIEIGIDDALAVHRGFSQGGVAAVRDWLTKKSSPIEDDAAGLFALAVHYRAEHLLMEAVDALAEIDGAIPATSARAHEVVAEAQRIMRGADAIADEDVVAPWDIVPEGGREDTPYHRWWMRTAQRVGPLDEGVGRADLGTRVDRDPSVPAGVETSGIATAMESGRPALLAAVRESEPGASAVLRMARAAEDAGQMAAAQRILEEFPGDVVTKKYLVWNHHTNEAAAEGLTLDEAIEVMAKRLDIHDSIEAMGSGRQVGGWAQPNRRVRRNGQAAAGSSVDDYIGASPAERVAMEARWKGRYQIPADAMGEQIRTRGERVRKVMITTNTVIRHRAAAFIERWGLPIPEGGIGMLRGTQGDVYLPTTMRESLRESAKRAGINDTYIWGGSKAGPWSKAANTAMRTYKMALLWGLGLPNEAYFYANAISSPFIMALTMGPRQAGRALSTWARHPGVAAQVLKHMSGFHVADLDPSKPGGLLTRSGRVFSVDALVEDARRYGLENSQARVETSRALQQDIVDADKRAVGMIVGKSPDGLLAKPTRYARMWQDLLMGMGHSIDQFFRISVFLRQIEDDVPPAQAAAVARDALFDYGAMSEFERFYIRKVVLFYAWQRKSMDALLYNLVYHPERVGSLARFANDQRRYTLDPREQLGEFDENTVRLVHPVPGSWMDPPDAQPGRVDYRYSNTFWYSTPLPGLDQIGFLANVAGLFGPERQKAMLGLFGLTNPAIKAGAEAAAGKTTLGQDLESGAVNEVPAWIVNIDDAAFGGNLQELLQIDLELAPDSRRASTGGQYRYVAKGNGARWWRGIRTALSRSLMSSAPEHARLLGLSEPKAGLESRWERLGDLILNPAPIESAPMLEIRAERDIQRTIEEETRAMRARRR